MSLARLLPHPRILTIVGAAGIALLASDVALSQQPAGAPPPQVPVETCTPGNCCWIMTKGLSGAFGMAFDQSAGSGHAVLVASGYDRLIHGPTTANACVAYWNRHIATRPGQTPWMAMPVGPLRNLPANPPPIGPGPVAGAPPVPPLPNEAPPGVQPVPGGETVSPPPQTGHWRFVQEQVIEARTSASPRDIITNQVVVANGSMSMTLTTDPHLGEGPSTWAADAQWSWNSTRGLDILVPGETLAARMRLADRSVPEQVSGWRHGHVGMSCSIRFDDPALGVGATSASAETILNIVVGEQKSSTQDGSARTPDGPLWGGRMALVAACGGIGKYQRIYQWVPPQPAGATPQGGAQVGAGRQATASAQPGSGAPPASGAGGTGTGAATPVLPPLSAPPTVAAPSIPPTGPGPVGAPPAWPGAQPPPVASAPRPVPVTPDSAPAVEPPSSPPPPAVQRVVELVDNWNPAACQFTRRAGFVLHAPTQIVNIELWYNWSAGETSVPFQMRSGNEVIARGALERTSCDPYQPSWCGASAMVSLMVPPGTYAVDVARSRVCSNVGSRNNGFIKVRGMQ